MLSVGNKAQITRPFLPKNLFSFDFPPEAEQHPTKYKRSAG
jgi:hypothetical protein